MGRIKTMLIKRTVNSLLAKYPDRFKDNFEENKKIVEEVAEIHSKKLRNVIAGYITRLVKKQKSDVLLK
ncbi:MAG: 30S ribosomal protein S17e [Candidatus Nanoarchaeia archaeon]